MYSVGTIFLQVAPSFDGLQRAAGREANAAGQRMSREVDRQVAEGAARAGKKAGRRYGGEFEKQWTTSLKKAREAFGDLEKDGVKRLAGVRKEMAALSKMKFEPGMDTSGVLRRLETVRSRVREVADDMNMDLRVRVNAGEVDRQARLMQERFRRAYAADPNVRREEERRAREIAAENRREAARRAQEARDEERRQREASQRRQQEMRDLRRADRERNADRLAELREEERRAREIIAINRRADAERAAKERDLHQARQTAASDERDAIRERLSALDTLLRRQRKGQVEIDAVGVEKIRAELATLDRQLDQLGRKNVQLRLGVNTMADVAKLRRLEEALQDVGKEARKTAGWMAALDAGSAANSVRFFNGVLTAFLALGPALIPVLAGISAGILGVGAAAAGAVLGVGVLVAGLSGIGGAVSALGDVDKERRKQQRERGGAEGAADTRGLRNAQLTLARAREDAGRRISAALRQEAEAERGLGRAREDAARSMADAQRRQVQAQDRLRESIDDVRKAQENLTAARETARRQLEDMNMQLAGAADAQRRAEIALQEARVRQNVVLEDDQATSREKELAALDVREAERALERVRVENARLAKDVKAANKAGVEGSQQVVSAKEREQDAVKAVGQAQIDLADAQADAARAQRDATQQIADAQQQLAEASADVARARVEEARTLADAERGVSDAMVDLRKQTVAAGVEGSAAMDALREAMLGLSPAGQAFAMFLYSLKPLLDDIRFAAQEGLLPGLQSSIQLLVDTYGPQFVAFVGEMSKVTGDLFTLLGQTLTSPFFVEFFKEMGDLAPDFLRQFGEVSINMLTGFAGILQALAPFMLEMGDALVGLTERFAEWGATLKDSEGFQTFLDYLRDAAPRVSELLGNLGEIFVKLMIGLAPYADQLLEGLIKLTDWLADMDPDDLAKIALGVGGIVLSLQLLAGALSAISGTFGLLMSVATLGKTFGAIGGGVSKLLGIGGRGAGAAAGGAAAAKGGGGLLGGLLHGADRGAGGKIAIEGAEEAAESLGKVAAKAGAARIGVGLLGKAFSLFLGPVGLVITIVWTLIDVMKWLYDNTTWFKEGWDTAWAAVQRAVEPVAVFLVATWTNISNGLTALWEDVLQPIFGFIDTVINTVIVPTFVGLWENAVRPTFEFIAAIFTTTWDIISKIFNMIYQIITYVVAPVFIWLWEHSIGLVIGWIGDKISWLYDTIWKPAWDGIVSVVQGAWDLIKPVFELLGSFVENSVAPVFQRGVDAIGRIWNGVLNFLRAPIKGFIDIVINQGLIGGFNWLAEKVPGMTPIDPVKVPAALYPNGKIPGSAGGGKMQAVATGGILDGWSPGRDIHRFISPTGGILDLSGGEGILRPELTRLIGKKRWDAANRAARQGRLEEGLAYLGGMSTGGVLPAMATGGAAGGFDIGDTVSAIVNSVAGVASALTDPMGFLRSAVDSALGHVPLLGGFLKDAASAVAFAPIEAMGKWISGLLTPDVPASGPYEGGAGANMGWKAQWAILQQAFGDGVRLHSAYRPGAMTATGYPSRHGAGLAVDITPSMDIFNWIAANFPNSYELIFTPAGRRQLYKGRNYVFPQPTAGMHYDHIHWSMFQGGVLPQLGGGAAAAAMMGMGAKLYDDGGDIPRGLHLIAHNAAKPDSVVTDAWKREVISRLDAAQMPISFDGANIGYDPSEIPEAIDRYRRDKLALAGLSLDPGV